MKFLNFIEDKIKKYFDNPGITISEQDVDKLASMCEKCRSTVIKRGFLLNQKYAYYIPDNESNLTVAKEIFERNGIPMDVHFSYITGVGQNVLRINYRFFPDKENLRKEMKKIRQRSYLMQAKEIKQQNR